MSGRQIIHLVNLFCNIGADIVGVYWKSFFFVCILFPSTLGRYNALSIQIVRLNCREWIMEK